MDEKFLGGRIKSKSVAMAGIAALWFAMLSFVISGTPPLLLLSISLVLLLLAHAARNAEKNAPQKIRIRISDR